MFFGYNFPKLEPVWMECGLQVRGHGVHSHKENGEIAPGVLPQNAKMCFLLSMQRGLSATYPAPISTVFETTDVNCFPYAYITGEKFPNFCAGGFVRLVCVLLA